LVVDEKLGLALPRVFVKPFHAIVQVRGVSSEGGEDRFWIRRRRIWFPIHPSGVNEITAGLGLQWLDLQISGINRHTCAG
jgi:hypothetical protein